MKLKDFSDLLRCECGWHERRERETFPHVICDEMKSVYRRVLPWRRGKTCSAFKLKSLEFSVELSRIVVVGG